MSSEVGPLAGCMDDPPACLLLPCELCSVRVGRDNPRSAHLPHGQLTPPSAPITPHLSDSQGLWQHRRHTRLCPGVDRVRSSQLAKLYSTTFLLTPRPRPFQIFPQPWHPHFSTSVFPILSPLIFSPFLNSVPQLTGSPPEANEIDCMWWLAMI